MSDFSQTIRAAQGRVFDFKDLNGAKLEVAGGAPVSLAGGALTAAGFASPESLRGVEIAATAENVTFSTLLGAGRGINPGV